MKKTRQFYLILLATKQIGGIGKLNQIFLGTLVLRKFRHPEEGLRERIQKVSDTMETRYSHRKQEKDDEEQMRLVCMRVLKQTEDEYGKTNYIKNGVDRTLDNLEEALEIAEIPEDCVLGGNNVSSVLKYLEEESKTFLKIGKIEPLNDEEISFLASLFKERFKQENENENENKSLEELVENVMKKNEEFNKLSEQPENLEERRKKAVRRKIRDLEDALNNTDIRDISGISDDNVVMGVLDYLKSELSES